MHSRTLALALLVPPLALASACSPGPGGAAPQVGRGDAAEQPAARTCAILSVNDTYRIEPSPGGQGGMAALRTLRRRFEARHPDLLVLHAGDFLYPSLLSRKFMGEQAVDVLNRLDGSDAFDPRLVVTFGNHELDDDRASVVSARLGQSAFRWLSSNIEFTKVVGSGPGVATAKIAEDVLLPCGGLDVGIYAVTTDTKKSPLVARFDDPVDVSRARSRSLRERGAEIVVGLTHLPIDVDAEILSTLGAEGPDLIVGGHEHAHQTMTANGRTVFKADADVHTANFIEVSLGPSGPKVAHRWIEVTPAEVPPDPEMKAVVDGWLERHEREYCREKLSAPPGCLGEVLTTAKTEVVAEELEIRRFETNLGDFAADVMLDVFAKEGAQIAFINAGTLRLNYNITPGTPITRRVIEELFAYPAPLRLIEITGAQLVKVLERATSGWTGQGHWLQIAGFAFRFDPRANKVSNVTLLGPSPRLVAGADRLKAVVTSFLIDPAKGQDGYTMIGPENLVDGLGPDLSKGPDLKQLLIDVMKKVGPAGLALETHGHVCNTERPGRCLAL